MRSRGKCWAVAGGLRDSRPAGGEPNALRGGLILAVFFLKEREVPPNVCGYYMRIVRGLCLRRGGSVVRVVCVVSCFCILVGRVCPFFCFLDSQQGLLFVCDLVCIVCVSFGVLLLCTGRVCVCVCLLCGCCLVRSHL